MNSLQIHYFLHLGKTGNVSETARQLFVAQSAVSKQIAALERELDVQLFERTNRGVSLTPGGEQMYSFFAKASDEYARTRAEAQKAMSNRQDILRIGLMENLGLDELSPVIQALKERYPALEVRLMRLDVGALIKRLSDGQVDLAITFDHAVENRSGVRYAELFLEESMFIMSRAHPLASRENLKLQDFSGQIICQTVAQEGPFADKYLHSLLNALCIKPLGYLSVDNMASGLAAVETNYAIGLIDERSQLMHPERYRLIGSGTYQSVVAAYLESNKSPYAAELTKLLQIQFRNEGNPQNS